MIKPKRKYARISPSKWSEIEAIWEVGDLNLDELADRYLVSKRALQLHFAKHKVMKGSKAAQLAEAVKQEIFAEGLQDHDLSVARALATREAAYNNAKIVEDLIMGQLQMAQKDPTQVIRAASALKALSLAAAGLERTNALRWRALGLDKESVLGDRLPVLVIRDLTEIEIRKMQIEHDQDNDFEDVSLQPAPLGPLPALNEPVRYEDEEIVTEGLSDDGPFEPSKTRLNAEGGKFVRGAGN
jgi:hypothetical protein